MNLQELRQSKRITLREAGERVGISRQNWKAYEYRWPSLNIPTLERIANAFNVHIIVRPANQGGTTIVPNPTTNQPKAQ